MIKQGMMNSHSEIAVLQTGCSRTVVFTWVWSLCSSALRKLFFSREMSLQANKHFFQLLEPLIKWYCHFSGTWMKFSLGRRFFLRQQIFWWASARPSVIWLSSWSLGLASRIVFQWAYMDRPISVPLEQGLKKAINSTWRFQETAWFCSNCGQTIKLKYETNKIKR